MIAATATRAKLVVPCARLRPSVSGHRNAVVVRADKGADAETPEASSAPSSSTVFYAGSSYTEESWAEAVKAGAVSVAPSEPVESQVPELSLGDLMAFSGPAPVRLYDISPRRSNRARAASLDGHGVLLCHCLLFRVRHSRMFCMMFPLAGADQRSSCHVGLCVGVLRRAVVGRVCPQAVV